MLHTHTYIYIYININNLPLNIRDAKLVFLADEINILIIEKKH